MNGLYSNKAECLLCIEINYSTLDRDFQNMGYNDSVYVCSGNRILLTNAIPNYRWQPYDTFSPSDSVGLSQHFTLYGEDLDIYVMEPSGNVLALIRQNIHILILLLILNIIPPQLLMNLLENSITSRLSRLEKVFNQIDSDVLIKISGPSGQDEIGSLMDNYNRMADRMNSLIDTAYRCRLKEQKMDIARQNAELMALYSQINPHFLFNTLNTISAITRRDPERARQLLLHLSLFFRKNLKRQNDLATLQEEQEHCQSYLEIEQARFGERLTVINEIPPHLADVQLPSFTLQPLIENAIKHGICSLLEQGRIRLFAEEGQESVTLCVEDNAGAWQPGPQGDGLGMSIVDRRLRSAFGERFGIRVQCEPEQWTRVSFTLPRQPQSPAKEPT